MKNRTFFRIAAASALLCNGVGAQAALFVSQVDASSVDSLAFNSTWALSTPSSYGVIFRVNEWFKVQQLGFWDEGADGLADAHDVGIFAPDQTLLASVTVPAGTVAPLANGFRWVPITGQLALYPGIDYRLAAEYRSMSPDGFRISDPGNPLIGTAVTVGSLFSLVDDRYTSAPSFGSGPTFPTDDLMGNNAGWFAGNIAGVPEPSTIMLNGLVVLAAAVGLCWRRQRSPAK